MIVNATAVAVLMPAITASAFAAMTDAEARKAIADFTESFVKAEKAGDAAGVAQHFAKDSIRVGPNGITNDWDAINKDYSEIYKIFREREDTVEVVKAIDDCTILVSGKWSGVLRGTIDIHGFYSFLAVCDVTEWKIKADMFSYSPDVIPPTQPKQ
jgi:hypothetical protein